MDCLQLWMKASSCVKREKVVTSMFLDVSPFNTQTLTCVAAPLRIARIIHKSKSSKITSQWCKLRAAEEAFQWRQWGSDGLRGKLEGFEGFAREGVKG